MLACVCRPVAGSLPKPPPSSAPIKRTPIVVTCEPRLDNFIKSVAHHDVDDMTIIKKVPGRPTAVELKAMALRQQQQIDSQHQLLAAKEQRLRFLKTQEARGAAAAAEGERLRRLRERVEAQESKLRRLRALRGQVDLQKTYNVTLSNDLDSIRALFSEKEKELTLAVAKVEALTRQLEDLRRDRRGPLNLIPQNGQGGTTNGNQPAASSPAARELEKLRRELMYRNQLSLQQDARLHLQREALQQRQAELRSVDQRILELQNRLQRKKASNLMHSSKKSSHDLSSNSNGSNSELSSNTSGSTNSSTTTISPPSQLPKLVDGQMRKSTNNVYPQQRVIPRGNVAAIVPYNHSPQKITSSQQHNQLVQQQQQKHSTGKGSSKTAAQLIQDLANLKLNHQVQSANTTTTVNHIQSHPESDENKLARQKLQEKVVVSSPMTTENGTSESSKFQTLPYASKFGLKSKTNECDSEKAAEIGGKTVHSAPVIPVAVNKSIAVSVHKTSKTSTNVDKDDEPKPMVRPKVKHQIPSGNLVVPPRKPISSVAPTLAPKNSNPKIHVVQPIATTTSTNGTMDSIDMDDKNMPSSPRPALPPKPSKSQSNLENNQNVENVPTIVSVVSKQPQPPPPPPPQHSPPPLQTNGENIPSSSTQQQDSTISPLNNPNLQDNLPIKARPLTIKKQPFHEQPKLKSFSSGIKPVQYTSRRIEMPPSFLFPEVETVELKDKCLDSPNSSSHDETDKSTTSSLNGSLGAESESSTGGSSKNGTGVTRRARQSSLSSSSDSSKQKLARRVSFDPLALLLDASLEGELELVKKTAMQVPNPSAANDEGITALHNAICAGHIEIVKFLVEFGCDVNAQDSDGWTPLHCAASCNNLTMVKFLVESGACLFAATLSDHETPAEKCEEDEEGFDGCSEYLYSIQEKLGILNNGEVFAVFSYEAQQPDEIPFTVNDRLTILRKGDDSEREWWWARDTTNKEGYVPRNLLGLYPRVPLQNQYD